MDAQWGNQNPKFKNTCRRVDGFKNVLKTFDKKFDNEVRDDLEFSNKRRHAMTGAKNLLPTLEFWCQLSVSYSGCNKGDSKQNS